MKFNTQLDLDVIALQQQDTVTCMLSMEAPVAPDVADRPGETVVVVADRSGSMRGDRLESVRSALHGLVTRLKPQDTFGLVTFHQEAEVHIPAREMAQHDIRTVHQLIDSLRPGSTTDLSSGYLLGLDQARRHVGATGASVLLLSDGHANQGLRDASQLGGLAASGLREKITTATIGIGPSYDETILVALAQGGNGAHRFAYTPDDAEAALTEEAGDLISKVAVNASVRVRPTDPSLMQGIGTLANVRRWHETDPDGAAVVVIGLGDLYSAEQRELLVQFDLPEVASLGLLEIATLSIEYVALPSLEAQRVSWPITVNVVPGDEAAGRIRQPSVVTAQLIAEINRAKGEASQALGRGDTESAARLMDEEAAKLRRMALELSDDLPGVEVLRERLIGEAEQAEKLARGARERGARLARKSFDEDRCWGDLLRVDDERLSRRRDRREW